jgi:hypothetical protein
MMTEHSEIIKLDFDKLECETIVYNPKESYTNKIYFDKFRNFIFSRYKINYTDYDINFPEVLLIKRDDRVNLISDPFLKKLNTNVFTGKERREIHRVKFIDTYLKKNMVINFKVCILKKYRLKHRLDILIMLN